MSRYIMYVTNEKFVKIEISFTDMLQLRNTYIRTCNPKKKCF